MRSRNLYIENSISFVDQDNNSIATGALEYQVVSRHPTSKNLRRSLNATINGDYDGNDNARITIHAIDAQTITTPILLTDTTEDATDINFNNVSTPHSFTNSVVMNKSTSDVIILKNLPINYKETMVSATIINLTSSEDDA